jgi:putative membrane protein
MKTSDSLILFFKNNPLALYLLFLLPVFTWSAISPRDIVTWLAEVFPLFAGIIIMIKSNKDFPLTPFSYTVIFIGSFLMLVGAHYTYEYVPVFEWIKSDFELERNNYDKVGHFFQGFITVIIVREFFLRKSLINSKKWTNFLAIVFSIALGALWEIFEWFTVVILIYFGSTKPASSFLGTQNYYWDAQSDILFAIIGALSAIVFFGKYHEKKIKHFISCKSNLV